MKAALPLVLTALLCGAVAQIAPGDPAGNQTIPEKDLSAEGGTQPDESKEYTGHIFVGDKAWSRKIQR